jgi:DNA-binding NarL/FixJ family response regulator
MANRSGLLEKESTAFAEEKPPVRTNYSSFSQVSAANVKLPVMDNLLEDTLVSIKKPAETLTKRESEILKLIIAGKTNKKIAQKIYRTERTVEYHRHRLMRKLGAHNAADLVKRAIDMGIV